MTSNFPEDFSQEINGTGSGLIEPRRGRRGGSACGGGETWGFNQQGVYPEISWLNPRVSYSLISYHIIDIMYIIYFIMNILWMSWVSIV